MRWHRLAVGAFVAFVATNAQAAPPLTCAERFQAAGIPDTALHAGQALRLNGEKLIVQIGDTPDAICARADKLAADKQAAQNQMDRLRNEKEVAEQKLAYEIQLHKSTSEIDYLVNHVVAINVAAWVLGTAFFVGWLTFFIGVAYGRAIKR